MSNNDSAFYREILKKCDAEMTCNLAITLIHQTDVFLRKLIEKAQSDFIQEGGIREAMTRARINYRNPHNK